MDSRPRHAACSRSSSQRVWSMPANLPARVMHHPGTRGLRRGPYSPAATDGSTRGTQMESFDGRLAVVTGGGTGMGRELVLQLAAAGASVATRDLHVDPLDDPARARSGRASCRGREWQEG